MCPFRRVGINTGEKKVIYTNSVFGYRDKCASSPPLKIQIEGTRFQRLSGSTILFSFVIFEIVQRKTVLEGILVGISISLFQ